ncbi:23649_t:CDS:2, partial [Gigaspora rosea]
FIAIDERDSELLVSEAKILSSQRIVPVVAVPFSLSLQPCMAIKPARKTTTSVLRMESSMSFGSLSTRKDSSFEQEPADLSTLINRNESPPASASLAASVKSKPPNIETLYSFLNFQSFDGSFLPSDKFYSWFGKNSFKDFESIGIENEKILCLALAMAYLELIMFEVGGDEQKVNENLEKAKEWVKKWTDE